MTSRSLRARHLIKEIDERCGGRELDLLSVSMTRGVIPRTEVTDKEARADDLSNYKVCRQGDIVVNRMSAYQGALGMSHQAGIVSPDYIVFRPFPGVEPRWLHHVMRSTWFVSEMSARIRGIGSIGTGNVRTPRVSSEEIRDIRVSVPEAQEQRAIADFLDSETARIEALIANKQRSMHLLQARVEALVADVLDPLISTYGETPLKFVASIDVSNVDKKTYEGQELVLLCNYTDVYYNRVINNAIEFMPATADPNQVKRLTLRAGDVLITKDSETADDIAVPALVGVDLPGVVLGYHLALLRPRRIRGDFLYWALRSRRCRDAFSLAASGVTRVGLRQDAMGRVLVPDIDAEIQQVVAQKLSREAEQMESMIRLLARQIELLREHRQALITAAVTGQIEIPGVAV